MFCILRSDKLFNIYTPHSSTTRNCFLNPVMINLLLKKCFRRIEWRAKNAAVRLDFSKNHTLLIESESKTVLTFDIEKE
mgnify:CR=1 FL=1